MVPSCPRGCEYLRSILSTIGLFCAGCRSCYLCLVPLFSLTTTNDLFSFRDSTLPSSFQQGVLMLIPAVIWPCRFPGRRVRPPPPSLPLLLRLERRLQSVRPGGQSPSRSPLCPAHPERDPGPWCSVLSLKIKSRDPATPRVDRGLEGDRPVRG